MCIFKRSSKLTQLPHSIHSHSKLKSLSLSHSTLSSFYSSFLTSELPLHPFILICSNFCLNVSPTIQLSNSLSVSVSTSISFPNSTLILIFSNISSTSTSVSSIYFIPLIISLICHSNFLFLPSLPTLVNSIFNLSFPEFYYSNPFNLSSSIYIENCYYYC